MRSVWDGAISFGMVVIPVKLLPATSDSGGLELHRVRRSDGSRVKMRRYAEADGPDGPEVPWEDTVMGYETGNGTTVLVEESDFTLAYGEKNRAARVITFIPAGSLPRVAHESTYYVQPGKGGDGAYALLAEALKRTGKVAVVSVAVRARQALALLYPDERGYLLLERLQWAADVGTPPFEAPSGVSEDQVEAAENLIALSSAPFDWAAQEDASASALADVIARKAETGQVVGTPTAPGTGAAPADLMAALAASVEAAKPKPPARKPRAGKAVKEEAA